MTKKTLEYNWRFDNLYGFVVSIMVSVFAFAGLYYGLSNKIDLLTQKMDYLIESTKTNTSSIRDLQVKYTELSVTDARCCPNN